MSRRATFGKMAERMRERGARTALVTTSDGRLVGLLYRDDAERLVGETDDLYRGAAGWRS